ncbi:2-oxoglutarate dehydrogenase [Trinickia violacea]|uniref:Dihydrolipoamide acetyltransferase component of pyruvate dehydrogenase complex n=1 Tax=Trinickia violacea TaxID=2571746 RepID=A0A4P8IPI7_9BURK|nr:2-oxo acid dehydrogenase subunit E2 [Trinickia violacea]QCP50852.1 2-oxoglutarate dehydrogenase [Trinickia violacea]
MITTVPTPRINTNDDVVEVVEWHAVENDYVEVGQDVVDVETSKTVVTIAAETAGFVNPCAKKGAVIKVGDPLYLCADSKEEFAAPASTMPSPDTVSIEPPQATDSRSTTIPAVRGSFKGTRFSKAALQLIRDRGMSPDDFPDGGLITVGMLDPKQKAAGVAARTSAARHHVEKKESETATAIAIPIAARVESVSLAKRAEIEVLTKGECGNINSMLSVMFDSHDIRTRLRDEGRFDGNIQPLILFEVSRLLQQWPQFTAYFDADRVIYYDRIDLGLAIDLGRGLKVVTIRDSDKLMPIDFFEQTIEIGLRYMENRLSSDELVGSTLTVTDLSSFDILYFHPLINGSQSAIVGIGGDSSQSGHPMSLNMTFDHRVSNGREVATFLKELRERLLSYAPARPKAPNRFAAPLEVGSPSTSPRAICCDGCGIELAAYMSDSGRNGYMLAYYRDDGSLGGVCHNCQGGF